MAVRFDGTTEALRRTTSFPTWSSFTVCFWLQITSDINDYNNLFYWGDNGFNDGFWIGTDSDGVTLRIDNWPSGAANYGALTVGTWYHIAVVNSGTTITPYINGAAQTTITSSQAPSNTQWGFGGVDTSGTPISNARMFAGKIWAAALTAAEISQEINAIAPRRALNLHGWWPMFPGSGERGRDYSGNAYDLTEAGTLSDEDPPPVSYGAAFIFGGGTASSGTAYSETAGVIEAWTASAADTRAGVDTSAAILGLVASSSDTRSAVDTGAATLGLTASAADTFSQSDTTAAMLGWVAASGDTGAGADTTAAALGWMAAGVDTFAQTDTTEAVLGLTATGADTWDGGSTSYSETAAAVLGWDAGASDIFTHSDTAAAELDFSAAAGETYAGFDTASPVVGWTVSASDSTASIDSVMALLGWIASVSDSTVSPDPSRIVVDVFQAARQVAQANKAVGQKIRKVSG